MDDANRDMGSPRHHGLELLRGLAALVVVASHSFISFRPELFGVFPEFPRQAALTGYPVFGLVNGLAAVVLFFTLSGFVLSQSALASGSTLPAWTNLIKRYPRLAGPILFATLASWLLFAGGLYFHEQAGAITGSPWLRNFGLSYLKPQDASFPDALFQGVAGALLLFQYSYNAPLWTMAYEFYGSIGVLFLTILLVRFPKTRWYSQIAMFAALSAASWIVDPWLTAFAAGLALSVLMARMPRTDLLVPRPLRWLMPIAGFYLMGYSAPEGAYAWLAWADTRLVHIAGSLLLMAAVFASPVTSPAARTFCRFLGKLSFPLYLIHVPIICSFSSFLMVVLQAHDGAMLRNALAVLSIAASVCIAWPLAHANEGWLRLVNRWARAMRARLALA